MANDTSEKPTEKVEEPKPKIGKAFFHKYGVNNKIPRPNGTSFKFERLADSQGVIVLDPDADGGANKGDIESAISELRAFVKRRIYGLSEIDEAKHDDLKKSLALPAVSVAPSTVRIFEQRSPLEVSRPPAAVAQPAKAPGTADLAVVGEKSATSVQEPALSSPEPPKPNVPRVGKPVPAKSRGPVENPPPAS